MCPESLLKNWLSPCMKVSRAVSVAKLSPMRQNVFMLVIHWAIRLDPLTRFVGIKIFPSHNGLIQPMTPANKACPRRVQYVAILAWLVQHGRIPKVKRVIAHAGNAIRYAASCKRSINGFYIMRIRNRTSLTIGDLWKIGHCRQY